MIIAENLKHNYGQLEVLKGINLQISQGEIVSILGASGAGKTTLLQIIGSLLKPCSGNVIINGQNIYELNEKKLANFRNQNIGFVFQFHHLLPEFTALENIIMPALIAKKKKKECEKKAEELLDILGILSKRDQKPAELSGGEKQRIAIARALINNPSIILADEPSGNLDSQNALSLYEIIFELRKAFNTTFIIVTHNEKHAEMTDKIFTIADGYIQE
jgi:lipoprotein-releasing system ATP-binding protein